MRSAILLIFWLLTPCARADMDLPGWYTSMDYRVEITNLADFPDRAFFYWLDDCGEHDPGAAELRGAFYPSDCGALLWIERDKVDPLVVEKLNSGDAATRELFHRLPIPSHHRLYELRFASVAEPVGSIRERMELKDDKLESRELAYRFRDGRTVALGPSEIDEKNPYFWRRPVRAFRIVGAEKFGESFVIVRQGVGLEGTDKWQENLKPLEAGKVYGADGEAFYHIYAVPAEVAASPRLAELVGDHRDERIHYVGGFFASARGPASVETITIEAVNGLPRRLSGEHLAAAATPAPGPTEAAPAALPPPKMDRRFFLGVPLAAALLIGAVLAGRRRK